MFGSCFSFLLLLICVYFIRNLKEKQIEALRNKRREKRAQFACPHS
jgi:hypothetical protein